MTSAGYGIIKQRRMRRPMWVKKYLEQRSKLSIISSTLLVSWEKKFWTCLATSIRCIIVQIISTFVERWLAIARWPWLRCNGCRINRPHRREIRLAKSYKTFKNSSELEKFAREWKSFARPSTPGAMMRGCKHAKFSLLHSVWISFLLYSTKGRVAAAGFYLLVSWGRLNGVAAKQ